MDEIDEDKQRKIEEILAFCKQKIDFLAEQKERALEKLVRQAKEDKVRRLADKIKNI